MAKKRTRKQRNIMNSNKNPNNANRPKKERGENDDSNTSLVEDKAHVTDQIQNEATSLRSSLAPPKGLSNLGNTCFFNSVMQNLSRTPGLLFVLNHFKKQEKMKIESEDCPTLYCSISPMGKLSKQLLEFLISMGSEENAESTTISTGRSRRPNTRNRVISPQQLFNKICAISPRFRGFQQQDSQELLHALLDGLKMEEIKRRKQAILSELNLLGKKAKEVDEDTRNRVKRYGHEATNRPTVVDLLFNGMLVSSVLCDECGTITQVYEEFLDISLPISESFQVHHHNEVNKKHCKGNNPEEEEEQQSSTEAGNQPSTPGNSKHAKKKMRKQNKRQHRRAGKNMTVDEKPKQEDTTCRNDDVMEDRREKTDIQYNETVVNILAQNLENLLLQSADESCDNLGINSPFELTSGKHEQKENSAEKEEIMEFRVENHCVDSFNIENRIACNFNMQKAINPHTTKNSIACFEMEKAKGDRELTEVGKVLEKLDQVLDDNDDCNMAMDDEAIGMHTNKDVVFKTDLSSTKSSSTEETRLQRTKEVDRNHGTRDGCNIIPDDAAQDLATKMEKPSLIEKVTSPMLQETNCPNGEVVMNGTNDLELEQSTKKIGQLPLNTHENSNRVDSGFQSGSLEVNGKLSPVSQSEQCSEKRANYNGRGAENCISVVREEEDSYAISSGTENTEPTSGNDEKELSNDEKAKALKSPAQTGKEPSLFETPMKEIRMKVMSFCDKLPTTLSQRYEPKNGECSVLSCLHKFTMAEMLTGNNKFGCERCTKDHGNGGKNPKTVYCNASKQMLIKTPPPILTIHLKRFQQAGRGLRKLNKRVKIPEEIDLSPFCCSESSEHLDEQGQLLYRIYGTVEHSGSLTRGHYTSYVKVHTENKRLVKNLAIKLNEYVMNDTEYISSSSEENDSESWYYISDTSVSKSRLSQALNSDAYLLFYERIFE